MVLTLARTVVTAETGAIVSKLAAADHVLPVSRAANRDVPTLARAAHSSERPELPHVLGLQEFASRMRTAVNR